MTGQTLTIDVVSDPVCPWCYVGLRSFLDARARLDGEFDIRTRYRPFMLNPALPASGVDRHAYYREKFPDAEQLAAARAAIVRNAEATGFSFDPSAPAHLPNTLKAHQIIRLAHESGRQDDVALAVYSAFWDALEDIGDDAALVALAGRCGIDAERAARTLASDADAAAVREEAAAFQRAGVAGVPTFIVGERTGFSGGMPPAQLADALRRAAAVNKGNAS